MGQGSALVRVYRSTHGRGLSASGLLAGTNPSKVHVLDSIHVLRSTTSS